MSQDNQQVPLPSVDLLKNEQVENDASLQVKPIPGNEQPQMTIQRASQNTPASAKYAPSIPLQQWVSQFQTTLDLSPMPTSRKVYPNIMDNDNTLPTTNNIGINSTSINHLSNADSLRSTTSNAVEPIEGKSSQNLPTLMPKSLTQANNVQPVSRENLVMVSDQIKQFQTSFQLSPSQNTYNKTSINAIINFDPEPEHKPEVSTPKEKKRKAPKKKSASEAETPASKKRKNDVPNDSTNNTVASKANSPLADNTVSKTAAESPKKEETY